MAIGSCGMFQRFMDQNDGKVIATLWCGDGTFKEDPEKNAKKFAAMAKKFQPDVVICGPCFNYAGYGLMAAKTALTINELVGIPAFAIMSKECDKAKTVYAMPLQRFAIVHWYGTGWRSRNKLYLPADAAPPPYWPQSLLLPHRNRHLSL